MVSVPRTPREPPTIRSASVPRSTAGSGERPLRRTGTTCAICALTAARAQPPGLDRWLRAHRGINNRLHQVLGQDLHQAGAGSGPRYLAVRRNLLLSLLRLPSHTNFASALRHHARRLNDAIESDGNEMPTTQ